MIPVIVLTAGDRLEWGDNASAGAWKRQQLQRELSTMSAQGEWIVVPGANHYIQLPKPSAVVEAIQRVVSAARSLRPARKQYSDVPTGARTHPEFVGRGGPSFAAW